MLSQTTSLYSTTKDVTIEPGTGDSYVRPPILLQLDVNYRWSSIVLNSTTINSNASMDKLKEHAYGGYGGSLAAGDRAPDAPALFDVKRKSLIRLFDLFDVSKHTVIVFNSSADDIRSTFEALAVLSSSSIVQTVVVAAPQSTSTIFTTTIDHTVTDTEGHAFRGYHISADAGLTVVAIRPDAYIGALVKSVVELKAYFSKVFR